MISHLSGKIIHVNERFLVLNVGGVGYKVRATLDTLLGFQNNSGKEIALWTHLAVREDALDLYGFKEQHELEFFELLISVSGVGPKSALGIMSVSPINHLKEAISNGDVATLTKVPGIGAKGAQKIILELRDKLGGLGDAKPQGALRDEHDAIEALRALGYTERDAREALREIPHDITGTTARIKEALKHLGK